MKKILPWIAIFTLIFTSLACSFTVNLPEKKTGPLKTWTVAVPAQEGKDYEIVAIHMGAGNLNINAGTNDFLNAKIDYNLTDWQPEVTTTAREYQISQNNLNNVDLQGNDVINEWTIQLGSQQPVGLVVQAGAYKGVLDLSGLPLTSVTINDGASQSEVRFDEPNPQDMDRLEYKTGASEVKMFGLGNSNADLIDFKGGAGSYILDFSGKLNKDMSVNTVVGISKLEIIVPVDTPATITVTGGLNSTDLSGKWDINGSTYKKDGSGPEINISVEMGLGSLELISK